MNRISEKIIKLRKERKLTQKQLAKSLGVSENYINAIEMGKKVINERTIARISKIFGEDLNDINMYYEDTTHETIKSKSIKPINHEAFTSVFSQVLKEISFLNYHLIQTKEKRLLPSVSNKIEGLAFDRVYFTRIENNSLSFLRILKGDISFCFLTKEFIKNGIYLINLENENDFFQIKELDKENFILLYSDKNSLSNEILMKTVLKNNIKILSKIIKVEFIVE